MAVRRRGMPLRRRRGAVDPVIPPFLGYAKSRAWQKSGFVEMHIEITGESFKRVQNAIDLDSLRPDRSKLSLYLAELGAGFDMNHRLVALLNHLKVFKRWPHSF